MSEAVLLNFILIALQDRLKVPLPFVQVLCNEYAIYLVLQCLPLCLQVVCRVHEEGGGVQLLLLTVLGIGFSNLQDRRAPMPLQGKQRRELSQLPGNWLPSNL